MSKRTDGNETYNTYNFVVIMCQLKRYGPIITTMDTTILATRSWSANYYHKSFQVRRARSFNPLPTSSIQSWNECTL